MPTEFVESGDFAVDPDARTVRGLLLPWDEASRLSASGMPPITFPRGSVPVPADVSIVTANRNHDRYDPVGRATAIEDTERGLVATFAVARTTEGDAFLDEYKAGTLRKLSAEIAGIVRNGARAVQGRLTGGAFVDEGAFASAALFAIGPVTDDPTKEAPVAEIPEAVDPVQPDDAAAQTETKTVVNPDGSSTITTTTTKTEVAADGTTTEVKTVTTETVEKPAAEEPTDPTNDTKEAPVGVPATSNFAVKTTPVDAPADSVFAAMTAAARGRADEAQTTMLAALADIKTSGTGALASAGVIQPAWLGEVWSNKAYDRRFWGLVKNGSLTNQDEKGFVLDQGTALIQKYAGNKAAVPTGTGSTSLVGSEFQRWALAVDVAREWFDIPGNQEVIEAFVRGIFNSYAKVTDEWALQRFYAAAGTQVDADTYPSGYSASIGKVLQVLDTINDSDVDATSVVVAPDVFKDLMYTPKDLIPEFISLGFGTHGEGTADSGVTVLRDKFDVLGAGQVLGVSRDAAHLNELPGGSPLTVDAVDIVNGGIDKGVHGYTQYMTEYADGFVLLGDKAAG